MKLNTFGWLALLGLAGAEGYQVYQDRQNSGGVPLLVSLGGPDLVIKTSTLLILAAIVAVIYVVHQAQTTVAGVAAAKSGAVTTIVQGATGVLSSFFNFLGSGKASGGFLGTRNLLAIGAVVAAVYLFGRS